jgi:hypothetical protein
MKELRHHSQTESAAQILRRALDPLNNDDNELKNRTEK